METTITNKELNDLASVDNVINYDTHASIVVDKSILYLDACFDFSDRKFTCEVWRGESLVVLKDGQKDMIEGLLLSVENSEEDTSNCWNMDDKFHAISLIY